jgi:ABC-type xylose transport system permease subunit
MREIKKIKSLSLGKIFGIMGGIAGLLVSLIGVIAVKFMSPADLAGSSALDILTAIVLSIIIYGVIGFIAGFLFAYFYNLVTKYTKGIKIELK